MITCYICNAKVHKIDFTPAKIKKLKKCNFWLDFESPKHGDLKPLEKLFGIHHLVIEDCLTPQDKRPKIMQHKGYIHIVMYAVTDAEKQN